MVTNQTLYTIMHCAWQTADVRGEQLCLDSLMSQPACIEVVLIMQLPWRWENDQMPVSSLYTSLHIKPYLVRISDTAYVMV